MKNFCKTIAALAAFLVGAFFFESCEKEGETAPFRLEIISGDGQSGAQGEVLSTPIRVRGLRPDGSAANGFPIKVVPRSGQTFPENAAFFSPDFAPLNATGQNDIKWELGCDPEQWLDVSLFSPKCSQSDLVSGTCKPIATVSIRATATVATGWVRACGTSNFSSFSRDNVKFREGLNGEIFMISNGVALRSKNEGLEWDMIPQPIQFGSGLADFGVSANGDYWALQNFEGVFLSKDRGQTWLNASQNGGIPFSNANRLIVDGDRVFANFDFGQGLFRTENEGQIWEKVQPANSFYSDFESLVRASTGDLFIIDDYPKLFKSTTNGDTWTTGSTSATNLGSSPVGGLTATENGKMLFYSQSGTTFYEYDLATNVSQRKVFNQAVRFPHRRLGKNFVLVFDATDASGRIYEGSGATYSLVDPAFDKGPMEAFYVTESGKFVLVTATGIYAKVN